LKIGSALILTKNLYFEMACNHTQKISGCNHPWRSHYKPSFMKPISTQT